MDGAFNYSNVEEYRRERIAEYVESISDETQNEWYVTIEHCAATKSNDMATFPLFGEFLFLLAKQKPEMAERVLLRANDNVLNFLAPFLKGLHESGDRAIYDRTIARYLAAGTNLAALARQCVFLRWKTRRSSGQSSTRRLTKKTTSRSWNASSRSSRVMRKTLNR